MNKSSISNRPRNLPAIILFLVLTVILLIVAAYLWHSHTASKDQLQQLSVQNSRLQEELAAAMKQIDNLSSGDPSPKTREQQADIRQSRSASTANGEAETLVLQTPIVRKTDEGLVVHFEYAPVEGIELPDEITLVVRVPNSSRILSLVPVSAPENSNVRAVVHPTGILGLIQGSPDDLGSMDFEFTVPAPVKATVRGTQGILDYEFDITPDGCTVRKL